MIQGLQPIRLEELRSLSVPYIWNLKGYLDGLETLTPVNGSVQAEHKGEFLNVNCDLSTIINLECDRCLKGFNQKLRVQNEELIWIGEKPPTESTLSGTIQLDELMEYLDPLSSFNPERWIFEQISLHMPLIKRCSTECKSSLKNKSISQPALSYQEKNHDPRWADLKKLL